MSPSALSEEPSSSEHQPPVKSVKEKPKKPCRVCDDFKVWTKKERKEEKKSKSDSVNTAASIKVPTTASQPSEKLEPVECPPDSQQLGRATWTFLHTMAAYYPDQPDNEQKANMKTLIKGFSKFYPCGYCATHLQEELKKNEPKVDNRSALSKWMCDIHNEVNERLGKPLFDCSKTDERWRDGPKDGSCD